MESTTPESNYLHEDDQNEAPIAHANFVQILNPEVMPGPPPQEIPEHPGLVNGQEVPLILDTGSNAIFVDRKLVRPEDFKNEYQRYQPLEGPPVFRQLCVVDLHCPFYVGKAPAFALTNPTRPVILGWVPHLQPAFKKKAFRAALGRLPRVREHF